MNKNKRTMWFGSGIALVALTVIIFMAIKPRGTNNRLSDYEYAEIKRGDLENTVDSTGTLSAVETVEVGSQVSGIIKTLAVDYNQLVKKDQILAELDRTPFEISVNEAKASLMRVKAKLNQAEAEYRRHQPLFDQGHIAETEYLSAQTTFETCQADCRQAEAALRKAQLNLAYTVIRSPINGTIIERTVNQGQTIAASFQAPKLFVIAQDLGRMQIEAAVDESDIGLIREGQNARFTVQSYPDKTFRGRVRQIRLQPQTIQNVVTYTVVIDAGNENGLLLPGMTATVDFLVEEKKNVLLLPNSALSFGASDNPTFPVDPLRAANPDSQADRGRVYYLDNRDTIRMAFLHKGASDGKMTELISSPMLKEGMRVVTGRVSKSSSEIKQRKSFFPPPPGGGPR